MVYVAPMWNCLNWKRVNYVFKINHLDMIDYDNNASFDDMTILK
jgi:hypothetical protein